MKMEADSLHNLPQVEVHLDETDSPSFLADEAHRGFLVVQSFTKVITSSQGVSDTDYTPLPLASLMFSLQDTTSLENLLKSKENKTTAWASVSSSVSTRLAQEVTQFDDVVIVDMVDVYRNLPRKLLMCHQWLFDHYKPWFVMKTDDDVFVNATNILSGLSKMDAGTPLWWGHFRSNWQVEHHGKWRESKYTSDMYPDFACGSGNVISSPVHQLLVESKDAFKTFQGEDISMGIWLSPFNVTYIRDPRWRCDLTCTQDLMTLPQLDVEDLHQYRNNSLTCSNPCEPC